MLFLICKLHAGDIALLQVVASILLLYVKICPVAAVHGLPAGSYTTQRLREIFSATWLVEDVILKDSKKKKKASALVVLSSPADAQEAAQEVHGDLKNPLLVVPYMKVMPGQEQQPEDGRLKQAAGSRSPSAAAVGNGAEPGARAPKQLLFASGLAGATSRPVQRPSKPLFPGR